MSPSELAKLEEEATLRPALLRRLLEERADLIKEHERDLPQIELIEAWLIRAGYPPSNPAMAAVGEMIKAKRSVLAKVSAQSLCRHRQGSR